MEFGRVVVEHRVVSLTGQAVGGRDYGSPKVYPGLF